MSIFSVSDFYKFICSAKKKTNQDQELLNRRALSFMFSLWGIRTQLRNLFLFGSSLFMILLLLLLLLAFLTKI